MKALIDGFTHEVKEIATLLFIMYIVTAGACGMMYGIYRLLGWILLKLDVASILLKLGEML